MGTLLSVWRTSMSTSMIADIVGKRVSEVKNKTMRVRFRKLERRVRRVRRVSEGHFGGVL